MERSLDPVFQQYKYFIAMQEIDGSASSVAMVIESPQTPWWYLLTEMFSSFTQQVAANNHNELPEVLAFTLPENHRTKNPVGLSGHAESLKKSQWACEFVPFDELFLKTEAEHVVNF